MNFVLPKNAGKTNEIDNCDVLVNRVINQTKTRPSVSFKFDIVVIYAC